MPTDAVRMADSTVTNPAVESKIKCWLRQARDRDGGRRRRFLAAEQRRSGAGASAGAGALSQMPTDDSDSNTDMSDTEPHNDGGTAV